MDLNGILDDVTIDLNGISEEDAKLIKHLTWLYGGYKMRKREHSTSEKHGESDVKKKQASEIEADQKVPEKQKAKQKEKVRKGNASLNNEILSPKQSLDTTSVPPEPSKVPPITTPERAQPTGLNLFIPNKRLKANHFNDVQMDCRKPVWPPNMTLADKINSFINRNIADRTHFINGRKPTTLSICNQFELHNHEAMVADSDRIHYYKTAIFWTGNNDNSEEESMQGYPSPENSLHIISAESNAFRSSATDDTILGTTLLGGMNGSTDKQENAKSNLTLDRVATNSKSISRIDTADTLCDTDLDSTDVTIDSRLSRPYCNGKNVLEIGTGPMCVLAMNARNAGAKSVDAIEVSVAASRLAGKLMAAYGCDDIIHVFNTHSKQFVFDQKSYFSDCETRGNTIRLPPYPPYDMIISEIFGDFASQEGVADVFLDIQRRILFENAAFINRVKSIPCCASTMFIPCLFPDHRNILNKASTEPEMTIISPSFKLLQSAGMKIDNLPLSESWLPMEVINLEQWMAPQMCQHYESLFEITQCGDLCGFLVGIDIEIRPGEHFGTRFGQGESWYTNLILLDREYRVYPGDLILVRSICNLTNYVTVTCDYSKIPVSRPSYSIRAFILSNNYHDDITTSSLPGTFPAYHLPTSLKSQITEEADNSGPMSSDTSYGCISKVNGCVAPLQGGVGGAHSADDNGALPALYSSRAYYYANWFQSRRLDCPENNCVGDLMVKDFVEIDSINLTKETISRSCVTPDDWLEGFAKVDIAGNIYEIIAKPPPILLDYSEQTCAIHYKPNQKKKLHTDPPKRYQKFKREKNEDIPRET